MKKRTSQLAGALFVLAVVLVGANARAQDVYNLADEFSTATNSDTTTWSYRYQDANILDSNNMPDNTLRNGVYTLMTGDTNLQGNTGLNGWANMNAGLLRLSIGDTYTPQIIKNITGADDNNGRQSDLALQLGQHVFGNRDAVRVKLAGAPFRHGQCHLRICLRVDRPRCAGGLVCGPRGPVGESGLWNHRRQRQRAANRH